MFAPWGCVNNLYYFHEILVRSVGDSNVDIYPEYGNNFTVSTDIPSTASMCLNVIFFPLFPFPFPFLFPFPSPSFSSSFSFYFFSFCSFSFNRGQHLLLLLLLLIIIIIIIINHHHNNSNSNSKDCFMHHADDDVGEILAFKITSTSQGRKSTEGVNHARTVILPLKP